MNKCLYVYKRDLNKFLDQLYPEFKDNEIQQVDCDQLFRSLCLNNLIRILPKGTEKNDRNVVPLCICAPIFDDDYSKLIFIDQYANTGVDKVGMISGVIGYNDKVSLDNGVSYIFSELSRLIHNTFSKVGDDIWEKEDFKSMTNIKFNLSRYLRKSIPRMFSGIRDVALVNTPYETKLVFYYPIIGPVACFSTSSFSWFNLEKMSLLRLLHERSDRYSKMNIVDAFNINSEHDIRINGMDEIELVYRRYIESRE